MKKSTFALTAIVVIVLSGIAVCSAILPSNESLPSNISTSLPATAQYYQPPPPPPPDGEPYPPEEPYPTYPPEEPYPSEELYYPPSSEEYPLTAPPAQEPSTDTPPAPGMTHDPTGEIVTGIGGTPKTPPALAIVSGPRLWIRYNGRWTMNSAAIYQGDWTYMLLYNDQYQWISTEETYPSGWVDKKDWGWRNSGYHYFRFIGDTVGWHRIIAVGSRTGQSNVIWVYVWPRGPTPTPPSTFTVDAWAGSSHYHPGDTSRIYYTVSHPCTARVTYLKQNSNVVLPVFYLLLQGCHLFCAAPIYS